MLWLIERDRSKLVCVMIPLLSNEDRCPFLPQRLALFQNPANRRPGKWTLSSPERRTIYYSHPYRRD